MLFYGTARVVLTSKCTEIFLLDSVKELNGASPDPLAGLREGMWMKGLSEKEGKGKKRRGDRRLNSHRVRYSVTFILIILFH